MTDQFRACCCCFRQWIPIGGERKRSNCLGQLVPNSTVTKHPTPMPNPVETLTRDTNDADDQAWRSAAAKAEKTGSPQLKWPARK